MTGILWNLVSFIVALGILVAVHEFGHFWVARRCGVRLKDFPSVLVSLFGEKLVKTEPNTLFQ